MCAEKSEFLTYINEYRTSNSLPAFTSNSGAACVAQKVADDYKGTACSNSTGTGTVAGEEPQLGESVVSSCNLQIANVKDGSTLPTCVPSAKITTTTAPKVAADSITESQAYNVSVSDPKYVSAGVGRSSDSAWYVLVLATNSSGGNYINQDLDPSGASMLSACLMFTTITAYMVLIMTLG